MFPRFCKLCYRTVDESIINLRRFSSRRQKKVTSAEYSSDDEPDVQSQEYQQEPEIPEPEEEIPEKKKHFIITCKNSKLNFYKGQIYPKFQTIPLASRSWHHRKSKGDYFTIYPFDENAETEEDVIEKELTFNDINIDSRIVKNLEESHFFHPTTIQTLGIPKILKSENVALTAETGCGKTYAFLIPIIHQVLQWKQHVQERGVNKPLGVILTPSKELTLQITKVAKELARGLDIQIIKFVGGRSKKIVHNPPISEVDIVIATAGVLSKLVTAQAYSMDFVRHIVLDEADTLLDDSFSEKVCHLLTKVPIGANRNLNEPFPRTAQLTLNSATIPQNVSTLLENIVDPSSIKTVTTGYEHQIRVPQKFMRLGGSDKPMALLKLVKPKVKSKIPVIVFSNTTETADFVSIFLKQFGINCVRFHKNMPIDVRKGKFMEFQNGHYHVLTTTDAGARGLDTTIAKDIINFDFPLITAEYIHRCGRVGRIGSPRDCRIYNFISKSLEIVLTAKIEFAARNMKPIPMVDLIHNRYKEDGEFLHGDSDVHEMKWDEDSGSDDEDKENNESNFGRKYSLPQ